MSDRRGATGGAREEVRETGKSAPTDWARFSAERSVRIEQARAGWLAGGAVALLAAAAGASVWSFNGPPEITSTVGFAVFAGVAIALLALALGPSLLGGAAMGLATLLGRGLYLLALPVVATDVLLRRVVAEACLLRVHDRFVRYAALIVHLGLAAGAVWLAPQRWPDYAWVGYAGLGWACLVALAVIRQWTWIERQYEGLSTWLTESEDLRLPDLRDEAIIAALVLLALVPVGLWRLDLSFNLFATQGGAAATWLDWAAFFGVELAKALPVVDWAEVYGARSDAVITPLAPYGQLAVFAARGALDLAVVGALIFVVARARQIDRQWSEFLAGSRSLVEPSLERRILRLLRTLAAKSRRSWLDSANPPDLGPFRHYNVDRLLALARDDNPELAAIATHAAFAQSPKQAFLPIAFEVMGEGRRASSVDLKMALLIVDLLGRAGEPAARDLLERVLAGFSGKSADVTWRVRARAAAGLTTAWRIAREDQRDAALEADIVRRLRYGLQRNRDNDAQIRAAIGDQLSVMGGAGALDALAEHLEHETSSIVLANFAGDMQRMIARAPHEPLRRASGVARLKAAELQNKGRKSDADKLAARALVQAAEAMDKAVRDQKREAVMGAPQDMVLVPPILERV